MRLLDLSFASPEDNLALDEALLHQLQTVETSGERPVETLRFWESAVPFVVLGRSLRAAEEVDLDAAARAGVPVLRRVSGGGTVVIGPGSLNFTIVLSLNRHPEHRDIRRSMQAIVTTIATALPVDGPAPGGHVRSVLARLEGLGPRAAPIARRAAAPRHAALRPRPAADGPRAEGTAASARPPREAHAPRLHAQPAAGRRHHERRPGARVERHAGRRRRRWSFRRSITWYGRSTRTGAGTKKDWSTEAGPRRPKRRTAPRAMRDAVPGGLRSDSVVL